jgi:predicted DNA-binding ribbon-helix-helix protein
MLIRPTELINLRSPSITPVQNSLLIPRSNKVRKRSLAICGHKTSVALEDLFWSEYKRLAAAMDLTLGNLAHSIEGGMGPGVTNLSSAIRLYVLGETMAERDARAVVIEAP